MEGEIPSRISGCEAALKEKMQEETPFQENLPEVTTPSVKLCRHEYVRIFQRRLKGLERRLVSTRAYLPTGFKMGDFGHLSEGSFCFCVNCRARLYPKRSQAEKAQARLLAAQGKLAAEDLAAQEAQGLGEETFEESAPNTNSADIAIDEMIPESVDVQDIEAEGVKIEAEEDSCELLDEEEN